MNKQAESIGKEKVELLPESQSEFKNKLVYEYGLKKGKLDAGLVGKFFGTKENAPYNIAGFIVVVVILLAVVMFMFSDNTNPVIDFCLPIVTLTLGYIFGQKN